MHWGLGMPQLGPCTLAGTAWGPAAGRAWLCHGGCGRVFGAATKHGLGFGARPVWPPPQAPLTLLHTCCLLVGPEHVRSLPCSPSYRLWLLPCVASRGIAQPLPPVPYLPALAVGEGQGLLFMSGRPKHSPDCSLSRAPMATLTTLSRTCAGCGEKRARAGAGP